jgi:hypothetical protein
MMQSAPMQRSTLSLDLQDILGAKSPLSARSLPSFLIAVRQLSDEQASSLLTKLLQHDLEGASLLDALIACLKEHPATRLVAARALAMLAPQLAAKHVTALRFDANPDVRSAALWIMDQWLLNEHGLAPAKRQELLHSLSARPSTIDALVEELREGVATMELHDAWKPIAHRATPHVFVQRSVWFMVLAGIGCFALVGLRGVGASALTLQHDVLLHLFLAVGSLLTATGILGAYSLTKSAWKLPSARRLWSVAQLMYAVLAVAIAIQTVLLARWMFS